MSRFLTNYDYLNVPRNATQESIDAAYRVLSSKYSLAKNQGDKEAAEMLSRIENSYAILSNPVKRSEHDKWIAQMELLFSFDESGDGQIGKKNVDTRLFSVAKFLIRNFVFVLLGAFLIWYNFIFEPPPPPPGPKPYKGGSINELPAYSRPQLAPNGSEWPSRSGYITGYPVEKSSGYSSVTIDNTRNDSDVFVKLVSLDGEFAYPVRHFYILAKSSFTLKSLNPGQYDIRYRDLVTGALSRSEAFSLEELQTLSGVEYSEMTMTLYKVQHGNMETYRLSESEF